MLYTYALWHVNHNNSYVSSPNYIADVSFTIQCAYYNVPISDTLHQSVWEEQSQTILWPVEKRPYPRHLRSKTFKATTLVVLPLAILIRWG